MAILTVLFISACGGSQGSAPLATVSPPVPPENQARVAALATPMPEPTSTQIPQSEPTPVPATTAPTATATVVTPQETPSARTATPAPTKAIALATETESSAEIDSQEQVETGSGPLTQETAPKDTGEPAPESIGEANDLQNQDGNRNELLKAFLERFLEQDRDEDAFVAAEWQKRIDAAFAPTVCESSYQNDYPSTYYSGPLIDTHLHIPHLPDDGFGGEDDDYEESKGVDSELYDSIAEDDRPRLGKTVNVNAIACTLQNEGTIKAFAFFPVFLDIETHLVEVARRTMEEYPSQFVPFIQSSGSVASIVEAEILQDFLEIHPELFFGLGEVGDSPTEPINPPPDSVLYTENFEVARNHNLQVYYHVGEGHQENMARALERFPEITFIVHGDNVRPRIDDLMDRYPNIYFTFNDIFEEHTPLFRFGDKEEFMSVMQRDWEQLLDNAVELYKTSIEAHPDRYMWGTDRADIAWNYDEDVGRLLAEYGRAFIGRLNPEVQENVAYRNAELLIATKN